MRANQPAKILAGAVLALLFLSLPTAAATATVHTLVYAGSLEEEEYRNTSIPILPIAMVTVIFNLERPFSGTIVIPLPSDVADLAWKFKSIWVPGHKAFAVYIPASYVLPSYLDVYVTGNWSKGWHKLTFYIGVGPKNVYVYRYCWLNVKSDLSFPATVIIPTCAAHYDVNLTHGLGCDRQLWLFSVVFEPGTVFGEGVGIIGNKTVAIGNGTFKLYAFPAGHGVNIYLTDGMFTYLTYYIPIDPNVEIDMSAICNVAGYNNITWLHLDVTAGVISIAKPVEDELHRIFYVISPPYTDYEGVVRVGDVKPIVDLIPWEIKTLRIVWFRSDFTRIASCKNTLVWIVDSSKITRYGVFFEETGVKRLSFISGTGYTIIVYLDIGNVRLLPIEIASYKISYLPVALYVAAIAVPVSIAVLRRKVFG